MEPESVKETDEPAVEPESEGDKTETVIIEKPAPMATTTVLDPVDADSPPAASVDAALLSPAAGAFVSDEPPPHAVQLKTKATPSAMAKIFFFIKLPPDTMML